MSAPQSRFGLHVGLQIFVAIHLGYLFFRLNDASRLGQDAVDSLRISMQVGSIFAPMILATIAGWAQWNPSSVAHAGFICAILCSLNPVLGPLAWLASLLLYRVGERIRLAMLYWFPESGAS